MSNNIFISVTAKDKIGIIANVTKSIELMAGDLTDLSQTVLSGYFTMILSAIFPDKLTAHTVKNNILKRISSLSKNDKYEITTWKVNKLDPLSLSEEHNNNIYVLTVKAKNRKGLVAEISAFCSDNKMNILSLYSEAKENNYTMVFLVDMGNGIYVNNIRNKLNSLADKSNLKIMLQHQDIFKSTNEISTS
jgi:glycine cleavage system transcriptional repressor